MEVKLLTFLLAKPMVKAEFSAISSHKLELVFCHEKLTGYGATEQAGWPVTARLAGTMFWTVYALPAEHPEPVPEKEALNEPVLKVLHWSHFHQYLFPSLGLPEFHTPTQHSEPFGFLISNPPPGDMPVLVHPISEVAITVTVDP